VAGEAALFAPPTDAEAFAAALTRLDEEKTWSKLSQAASTQAMQFSWQASAERLLDVLDQVGGARGRGERL